MPHFRVDDALHSHPKARQAGLEAMGLWNLAGSYAMGYLTDGFVPEWYVTSWPKGATLAKRLVSAGLWNPATRDGEKGWQFHQFTGPGRNDTRAQVEESRRKWRDKKAGQRGDSPTVSQGDRAGDTAGEAPGESPPDSLRVTRDPTQPYVEEISGYVRESATEPTPHGIAATPAAEIVRRVIPRNLPDATRTALRHQTSALLNTGTPASIAEEALRDWLTKTGVGPGILPSLAADVVKRQNGHTTSGKPASKLRAAAELAAEIRAEEQATTAKELR